MTSTLKRPRYLATAKAQAEKLAFLAAAADGDGDVSSLFALADWYTEHGADRAAANVRHDAERYSSEEGRTASGKTWLCWYARYQLGVLRTASPNRRRPSWDTPTKATSTGSNT